MKYYSLITTLSFLIVFSACEKDEEQEKKSLIDTDFFKEDVNYGNITDVDGNNYKTVTIGEQTWMAENLRTTKYNSGDIIASGLSDDDWANSKNGAYAVYDYQTVVDIYSEEDMIKVYGKLYNWHAVNDPRGICPAGWRVPTTEDWHQLSDYIVDYFEYDNNSDVGNVLKSCRQIDAHRTECDTDHHPRWLRHSSNFGFDYFGFNGLPSGRRNNNGQFSAIGSNAYWWTSTERDEQNDAWRRVMSSSHSNLFHNTCEKNEGHSVRCIKE